VHLAGPRISPAAIEIGTRKKLFTARRGIGTRITGSPRWWNEVDQGAATRVSSLRLWQGSKREITGGL